jgi:mono/diheme cytochrome c family protein
MRLIPKQSGLPIVKLILIVLFACGFPEIGFAAGQTAPTFTHDVAPILFQHCVTCHRAGELASRVPLTSYDTARPWVDSIKLKVASREMPPWPADPAKSVKFRNDARLSQQDIDTIVAWVNAGAPKGNDTDLPSLPKYENGWMHPDGRKPDVVISLPGDLHVPAKGEIPYVRLLVKVPFSDDRWISASQTRAGTPAVVHHMALTEISLPAGMTPSTLDTLEPRLRNSVLNSPAVTTPSNSHRPDMLGIYTPGSTLEIYPEGSAKLLKGGTNMYLIFNIHYETTGVAETDRSSIGLWFRPGPPEHQLFRVNGAGETIIANGKELLTDGPGTKAEGTHVVIPPIPPMAENYELVGVTGYPEPITIYQFQPHAHHRAKDFTYTVVYPDGREQTLLSVPKYDHRWQMAYELETPLKLPAGSKLVVTAHYDNSTMNMSQMNMHNHAPDQPVYFRDMNQSWDEMFTPFIQYSIDARDEGSANIAAQQDKTTTKNGGLMIGEVVGCLERNPAGEWLLTNASEPTVSEAQATSSVALKAGEARPLGSQRYRLLGAGVFAPSGHQGEKVAVKGIFIDDPKINEAKDSAINVTSLQAVGTICMK